MTETDTTAPTQPARKPIPFWVIVAVPLVIVGLCIAGAIRKSGDGKPDENTAATKCETYVKARLKSPSTAEFSDETFSGSHPEWTIYGAVDSQNSFGAMVRTRWTCKIRVTGDTTWTLVNLKVG